MYMYPHEIIKYILSFIGTEEHIKDIISDWRDCVMIHDGLDYKQFKNLEILHINNFHLHQIPSDMPKKIKKLYMYHNNIEYIPDVFHSHLLYLNLNLNQIYRIKNLPPRLKILHIDDNQIYRINNIPAGLEKLYINYNNISKINNLPETLKVLSIEGNSISKIENLPIGLEELYIASNNINIIENLPPNLKKLDIEDNNITHINNLPKSLEELYIDSNLNINIENMTELLNVNINYNQYSF